MGDLRCASVLASGMAKTLDRVAQWFRWGVSWRSRSDEMGWRCTCEELESECCKL